MVTFGLALHVGFLISPADGPANLVASMLKGAKIQDEKNREEILGCLTSMINGQQKSAHCS